MKITEIFHSVQGEIDVGVPMIFIRLSGCNMVPKCKFCDTSYSWKDVMDMPLEKIIKEILKYPCYNICFTGGEPTLQADQIMILIEQLDNDYNFYLETNGTRFLNFEFLELFKGISCSPKKQNIDDINLVRFSVVGNCRFKFVYENKKDLWWEKIIKDNQLKNNDIWIMPEGRTKKEQEKKTKEVIEYCKSKNYNFTPRLHVLVWNTKKGV